MRAKRDRFRPAAVAVLVTCLFFACRPSPVFVAGHDEKFPRIRFLNGQVSVNDRCPIKLGKLNTKMVPVEVNGRPIGFC